jgi:hypothetical protein
MTALVLDAGALIALDRNDRSVWAMRRNAADDATPVFDPTDLQRLLRTLGASVRLVTV